MPRNIFLDAQPITLRKVLPRLILLIALVAFFVYALLSHFDGMPIVYKQATTGRCLHIELGEERTSSYTCTTLPDRYTVVWVEDFQHPLNR